ncbi:PIF1-like helicase [Nitzschia inconspicua]|uniref:ATP-dependent DNA helicase n=1 Tax=Nitzschia inconspicua TaxID=303405 RepID=A0A9K3PJ30_9STRA|nr:PIF1-like helicase [Nitzschia inconspicua]
MSMGIGSSADGNLSKAVRVIQVTVGDQQGSHSAVNTEDRMKIPSPNTTKTLDDVQTKWYDWRGNDISRALSICVPKRAHVDAFVNVNNAFVSTLFGCNTNVATGLDGGSVMYCTCYISKNTEKEDSEHFASAAKHMVKRMEQRMMERMVTDNEEQEKEDSSIGLKSMIDAALMATKDHKVAAPMASYLIRNGSRFHYSHFFAYVNIGSFFKDVHEDFNISADGDGKVFLKSSVANYIYRPMKLECVCVYDFLAKYSACKPTKNSFNWAQVHPNKDHLKISQLTTERIPVINYLDFVDTRNFNGNDIFSCNIEEISVEERVLMEEHAKSCCVLFVPFRNVEIDLKLNGSYLQRWRKEKDDGRISKQHERLLTNVQNCRNSLHGARPLDILERSTSKPVQHQCMDKTCMEREQDDDDVINNAMDDFLLVETPGMEQDCEFRDSTDHLQYPSILTRCHGSHTCGTSLIICPNVAHSDCMIIIEKTETSINGSDIQESESNEKLHICALNELALKIVNRIVDKNGHITDIEVNGTLKNIRDFAEIHFSEDVDQKKSFEIMMCAFLDRLYKESNKSAEGTWKVVESMEPSVSKKRKSNDEREKIGKVNDHKQLIGFLSGAGGTGKSHVIKTACQYAQKLCKALGVKFDKRTIVVTALTGAAAVSINGETKSGAFAFKRKVKDELEEFKNTYLVIVDEVSFASVEDMELLNEKMKQIFDNPWEPFGGVPIVFSGDFAQLSPVGGRPLYKSEHSIVWKEYLNAFMQLRTNHRFDKDVNWGAMLGRFRDVGLSTKEVAIINTRVVGARSGPRERNIPFDAVYATKTNVDRMAINDAIIAKHLENTHSTDPGIQPPMHTLCIKAGNLRFHVRGTRREYCNMKRKAQDIIYAAVGEAHVEDQCNKRHDPLLKLYYGRPLYINHNEDVAGCVANGAICEFRGVKLKPAVSQKDFETIIIDGYHVNCVSITQVDSLLVNMLDSCKGGNKETIIELTVSPKVIYASAKFPVPFTGPITKNSMRTRRRISFEQFPVNCANARTVHKLQGRSIHHLVVSAWDYTDNWVYVCLSRCTTMNGLFLREPLNPSKTKGMAEEVRAFIKSLRKIKKRAHVFFHGEDL